MTHESDPPSPWAGYKLCMADPPDCTHLLIIQDDTEPAPNFAAAVEQIALAHPERPVCLFISRLPRDTRPRVPAAMKMGRRYVRLSNRSFLPVVAVLWPIEKLREFDEWSDENPTLPGQLNPRSDDAMGGRWKMLTKQDVYATVPSIVQHHDQVDSTIDKDRKDNPRTAAYFADDAAGYDWSMP